MMLPTRGDGDRGPSASGDAEACRENQSLLQSSTEPDQVNAREWLLEAYRIWVLAYPLSLQNLLTYCSSLIIMGLVGRLGTFELSAAVLGTSIYNVSGLSIMVGLSSASETLNGQAFGAKRRDVLGVVLQRALLVCGVAFLVIVALWTQVELALKALGQNPAIASAAARYVHLCAFSLVSAGVWQCLQRYLMVQGLVLGPALAAAAATLLSPLMGWLLIFRVGLGLDGAALALGISNAASVVFLLAYMAWQSRGMDEALRSWHGWTWKCLQGWGQYLGIALPSTVMLCMEWWMFEIMVLLAGLLPRPQVMVDVMGISFSIATLAYMIPLGISGAASTRVGNELGAGRPRAAARVVRTALAMVAGSGVLIAGAIMAARALLGRLFSDDAEVLSVASLVLILQASAFVGDAINGAMAGVIRGCGRQTTGAALNVVTYWVLGVPTAAILAFTLKGGIYGLWTGLLATTSIQAAAIVTWVWRIDWAREARRAAIRVQRSSRLLADGLKLASPDDTDAPTAPGTVVLVELGAQRSAEVAAVLEPVHSK